jgi:hypothetical protein
MSDGQAHAHWFSGIENGSVYSSDFNPDPLAEQNAQPSKPEEPPKESRLHSIASTTWSRINTFIHRSTADHA